MMTVPRLCAFSGPDSPIYTGPYAWGKLHFPFKYLLILMLRSMVINLLNKATICLTQKMKLCFFFFYAFLIKMKRPGKKTVFREEKVCVERWACLTVLPEHTTALRQRGMWGQTNRCNENECAHLDADTLPLWGLFVRGRTPGCGTALLAPNLQGWKL